MPLETKRSKPLCGYSSMKVLNLYKKTFLQSLAASLRLCYNRL